MYLYRFGSNVVDAQTIDEATCALSPVSGFPKMQPGLDQWIEFKAGPSGTTLWGTSFDQTDPDEGWVLSADFATALGPVDIGRHANHMAVFGYRSGN